MRIPSLLLCLCLPLTGCAPDVPDAPAKADHWQEHAGIGALFDDAGVTGTFVAYIPDTGEHLGHDATRAAARQVPASTFKIPNSLIGLTVGAVSDVEEPLPYGGGPQFMPAWERDMGLREAMALSSVPIFQELARRIGLPTMQAHVTGLEYGNRSLGDQVDRFWLEGPLEISALEQTHFLARLARNELPLPTSAQAAVRDILLLEQGDGWRLYGKTGWQNAPEAGTGWWVGWVERQDRPLVTFALNLELRGADDAPLRMALGKAALKALELL